MPVGLSTHHHHQGVDSGYHNLGDTTLSVYNRNCVKTSIGHLQLYLVVHSQVGDCHNQLLGYGRLGVVILRVQHRNHARTSTSYDHLHLGGHSQVSDCHHHLVVMATCGIKWS